MLRQPIQSPTEIKVWTALEAATDEAVKLMGLSETDKQILER